MTEKRNHLVRNHATLKHFQTFLIFGMQLFSDDLQIEGDCLVPILIESITKTPYDYCPIKNCYHTLVQKIVPEFKIGVHIMKQK